jgi:hypothetical protein
VLAEICRRLAAGRSTADCRDLRGVAYLLGGKEELHDHRWDDANCDSRTIELPSFEQVTADKRAEVERERS